MTKFYLEAAKRIASEDNVHACCAIEDSIPNGIPYFPFLFEFGEYFRPDCFSNFASWWGIEEEDRLARTLALLLMQEIYDENSK
jgi:hypothetical protein